ncbi:MAG: Na+/H+ antiporter [Ardenticatenaceae bacterium]|nr:Na+/H+ antiporter [Ardenticatenaceae bacterium]MCB9446437.1 Na+/H+ antiporter [Ardenticatenaceae bacterium]
MNFIGAAQESISLIDLELGFVILLSIAALVAIFNQRIRMPYTVALVVAGLLFSFFPNFLHFSVSSDLILAILVPPLLFEATLHIKWEGLKFDLVPILLLAFGGTLISTIIVGGIVVQVLDVPFVAAVAFGALISATDPVAVIAFFRSLGVSKRLAILVEGESLFNDGVAIVLFNLAIAAAAASSQSAGLVLSEAVIEFLRVAVGGLAVGLGLGFAVSYLILKNVDNAMIETATSVALAFGAFVIAEEFHLSGILAVVAAGLMVGNIGMQNTSPTTKLTLENFWEFLAYAVNSLVFLVIGLEVVIEQLFNWRVPILVAVVAILLSRAVVVYSLTWLHGRFTSEGHIPRPYRHVMYWGGLRGAISLALALTLTGDVFGGTIDQELRVMTFGVVLFTLLVQGTTIEKLIRRLGLAEKPPQKIEQQRRQALLYAKMTGQKELERMRDEGILFKDVSEAMDAVYEAEIAHHKVALREHLQAFPELEQDMYLQARADVIKAERNAYGDAARRGFISDEMYEELIEESDKRLAALEIIKANQRWRVESLPAEANSEDE